MRIKVTKVEAGGDDVASYRALRRRLWPMPEEDNRHETKEILADAQRWAVFVARLNSRPAGFLEVQLRENVCDYVEEVSSSPVGYLEGWYVTEEARNQGVRRSLIISGEEWARSNRCSEMVSDTQVDNLGSIEAHGRLGYLELGRVVYFMKTLK